MTKAHSCMGRVGRREFLRASGVALALPALEAFLPRGVAAATAAIPPRRLVCICSSLGFYPHLLFPEQPGADYAATPYLELLSEHRKDFALFSGLSHPHQSGLDGHSSELTWLTAAFNPGLSGFRNTVSLDQLIAMRVGSQTRFPSLQLGTNNVSISCTPTGVMLPAEISPSRMYSRLFLSGTAEEMALQQTRLRQGRSVLDAVGQEARLFQARMGKSDREKLDEYFTSVREMEQRLVVAEEWAKKPKPRVSAPLPRDVTQRSDLIGKMRLLLDLVVLALQTDSTRVITVMIQGQSDVPPVPGVTVDHHNLSHHGQDSEKIRQLKLIEQEEIKVFRDFLTRLKAASDGGGSLLDSTTVLFGSNLGNANAHDTQNLPIFLAGGGVKQRGTYVAASPARDNQPLCNLFVGILNHLGIESDRFGSSTRAITLS